MSYRFDLKDTQLYLLLGGMVAAGALLFVVGLLIGASSKPPATEAAQSEDAEMAAAGPVEGSADEPADGQTPASAARVAPLPLPESTTSQQRIYELQLSAHLDMQATQPVLNALSSSNLKPYLVETTDSRQRTLYTVRLGPWDSMAEAAEAARAFRDHADLDAYEPVIRHRPKPLGDPGTPAAEPTGSG